jgi:hypothetical protein
MVIAAGFTLAVPFIDHYVTHRRYMDRLIFWGLLICLALLCRYVAEAVQRRRTRAQRPASHAAERNAAGG